MDRLGLAYEKVIRMVEEKEVTPETDRILQQLGEEMQSAGNSGEALIAAADYLCPHAATEAASLGRVSRLGRQIPARELGKRLSLLIDLLLDGSHKRALN